MSFDCENKYEQNWLEIKCNVCPYYLSFRKTQDHNAVLYSISTILLSIHLNVTQ